MKQIEAKTKASKETTVTLTVKQLMRLLYAVDEITLHDNRFDFRHPETGQEINWLTFISMSAELGTDDLLTAIEMVEEEVKKNR